ncbi:MAG: flavin reductase family protein [Clostridiales bacterium]|nr:flavin reductase family protein [Clostridiales bacterium]
MKKINAIEYSAEILEGFKAGGVFLNSKLGDKINTMTMGWGSLSVYWGMPILIAPVRISRHSHHMIDESGVFTVSIPAKGMLKKELSVCGSQSGRDIGKFDTYNITAQQGQVVNCPVVGEARIQIECKVVAKTQLPAKKMTQSIIDKWYDGTMQDGDYHTLFFGEIVDAYIID